MNISKVVNKPESRKSGKVRVMLAALLAPLGALLFMYGLLLIAEGPSPDIGAEIRRITGPLLPAVAMIYAWALLAGAPLAIYLHRRHNSSTPAYAIAGAVAGALPILAAGFASGLPAADLLYGGGAFAAAGMVVGVCFRWLATGRQ